MRGRRLAGLTGALLLLAGLVLAWRHVAYSVPPGIRDIPYTHAGGPLQSLDLYIPKTPSKAPWPVVVVVHPGGWKEGDKSHPGPFADLVSHGFAVASVNYRLAPQYRFPAPIEDVKAAVRFLRSSASFYHLDPARFGAWGESAGGHLVALLGLAGRDAGWDVGEHLDQSSGVQAVVDLFGAGDLTDPEPVSVLTKLYVLGEFGDRAADLRRGSPVTWVHTGAPPFLIMQGMQDQIVPFHQAQMLYDRLHRAGVPSTLVMVQHAGHMFEASGGKPEPSLADLRRQQIEFLTHTLRN